MTSYQSGLAAKESIATENTDESSSLLGKETDNHALRSHSQNIYHNFLTMAIAFSLNHGCVVSCLAYASAELGNELGGYGSGCLYVFYALTAFLFSKGVVSMVGPKNGLLLGLGGYCVYVISFLIALLIPNIAWPVFIIGNSIGGISGGLLWTSQGRYFARNAKLFSEATGTSIEHCNSTFAGVFAFSYLGLEMATKALATIVFLLFPDNAERYVFSLYAALAVLAYVVITSISELEEFGTWDLSWASLMANITSAGRVVMDDHRLAFLVPFQIAFGFTSSFVPFYVFGTVIATSTSLGSTWVGLLSALIVFVGAVIALPSSWLSNKLGKPVVMTIGGFCLLCAGLAFFLFSDESLGTWSYIVPYLFLYGIGRGTWENTNKAVIADFFSDTPDLSTSAFAAVAFSNGLAGSIGYFTFPEISRSSMAGIVVFSSLIAIVCYWVAAYLHQEGKRFGGSYGVKYVPV